MASEFGEVILNAADREALNSLWQLVASMDRDSVNLACCRLALNLVSRMGDGTRPRSELAPASEEMLLGIEAMLRSAKHQAEMAEPEQVLRLHAQAQFEHLDSKDGTVH